MKQLPVWFAYAIERLPLISSFYEIQYGVGIDYYSRSSRAFPVIGAAFIQLRRNHDKEAATGKEIAKAIAGALLHDILNPLRLVDATVRTVLNLASLALAPLYAIKHFIEKVTPFPLGYIIAFFPLTLLLWIVDSGLSNIGSRFQSLIGRQGAGLSYQEVKEKTEKLVSEAKNGNIEVGLKKSFFNARPPFETIHGWVIDSVYRWVWRQLTTLVYGALGLKAGRLEHLQNQTMPLEAELLLAEEMNKGYPQDKEAIKLLKEAIELRTKYATEDLPHPSLVYSLAEAPYQAVAAVARAIENKISKSSILRGSL